ncbi:hypothetical protein DPMN_052481 [Dreissena polymorpha]|uniref:Uncharacterized protein n=1 Tax=Dreissena polymorpha TaxID=45954 RepID=A0A9D4CL27_DREPO|nr:hypothetical protein DPMN_052481 [Dreissena polymorpha]
MGPKVQYSLKKLSTVNTYLSGRRTAHAPRGQREPALSPDQTARITISEVSR